MSLRSSPLIFGEEAIFATKQSSTLYISHTVGRVSYPQVVVEDVPCPKHREMFLSDAVIVDPRLVPQLQKGDGLVITRIL
jgi:hypothetical protein